MKRIILAVLIVLSVCGVANAVPVYYTATGTFNYGSNTYNVSGNMMVENQLTYLSSGEPVPEDLVPYGGQFRYNIYSYFFQIGEYAVYGVDGSIFMDYMTSPTYGSSVSDTAMSFSNAQSNGPWVGLYSILYSFIDIYENELPRDWASYSSLAPMIQTHLWGYDVNSNTIGHGDLNFRQTPFPAPVPEPTTIILLGSGLLCLIKVTRKTAFNQNA